MPVDMHAFMHDLVRGGIRVCQKAADLVNLKEPIKQPSLCYSFNRCMSPLAMQDLTFRPCCSFRKENGVGGSSPFCSKRHEVLMVRASTLGGVPAVAEGQIGMKVRKGLV